MAIRGVFGRPYLAKTRNNSRSGKECHVLDIDADSWREKEAHEFAAKAVKKSQAKPPKRPKPKR